MVARQRTTYLPGEIGHADWWEPRLRIPVGNGAGRRAYGLVGPPCPTPRHATVFAHFKTLGDVRPAFLGCFTRLGGVREAMVVDNELSIVAAGKGRAARVHDEIVALFEAQPKRLGRIPLVIVDEVGYILFDPEAASPGGREVHRPPEAHGASTASSRRSTAAPGPWSSGSTTG